MLNIIALEINAYLTTKNTLDIVQTDLKTQSITPHPPASPLPNPIDTLEISISQVE